MVRSRTDVALDPSSISPLKALAMDKTSSGRRKRKDRPSEAVDESNDVFGGTSKTSRIWRILHSKTVERECDDLYDA